MFATIFNKHITDGTLIPAKITCDIILQEIKDSPYYNFIIDGFPANQENLDAWAKYSIYKVNKVFLLQCPIEVS